MSVLSVAANLQQFTHLNFDLTKRQPKLNLSYIISNIILHLPKSLIDTDKQRNILRYYIDLQIYTNTTSNPICPIMLINCNLRHLDVFQLLTLMKKR